MNRTYIARTALWASVLLMGSACSTSDILDVNNPDEIAVGTLNDPRLLQVRMNGVVDAFDNAYVGWIIQYSNFITDEVITGLNFEDYARANQRIVSYLEGPTTQIFENLSRTLRLADGLAEHIRGWAAADPATDFDRELATSLIYAGYAALVLAENSCQSVISPDPDNPSGTVLSQLETFEAAFTYQNEALSVEL